MRAVPGCITASSDGPADQHASNWYKALMRRSHQQPRVVRWRSEGALPSLYHALHTQNRCEEAKESVERFEAGLVRYHTQVAFTISL